MRLHVHVPPTQQGLPLCMPTACLSACMHAAIVKLLRDLHDQALEQGGAVYMLNGNHESLNVCGDFR